MRSLTLKLTLAFLFVSLVGVILVAVFVRQQTQSAFRRFVLDRYQVDLLNNLAEYYEQNGNWDDFSAIVVRTPMHYGGRPGAVLAPVTLADTDGEVIYGGLQHNAGDTLSREEIKNAVSVEVEGETVGWLLFAKVPRTYDSQPESPEFKFLEGVNRAVLLGIIAAVGVALVIGIILARTISEPVREVTAATQKVASGDFGYQVQVRTKDEIGDLADSFNKMSSELEAASKQRRQMTADIAHDLRTPLSVILGYMESLATGKLKPSQETFEVMYAKGLHVQHLIDDLRILALADAGELPLTVRPVSPSALLEHTALAYMIHAQEKDIDIKVEVDDDLPDVQVDPDRMTQVLSNLVSNALRYTPMGGTILLAANQNKSALLLTVRDSGAGIHPEDLPHIFDRFYRGDDARSSNDSEGESGLGLAIAKSIVSAHGGTIAVTSVIDEGTTFTIELPYQPG